ncbi:hypothetical protein [Streptomyces uncialis]|uniref:hypothetical protein n=1 Tax=Streptomyces uncialis TaxID=1048205 RepID=UPI003870A43D|nr:hypothetical protein OG268_18140 [Streptomyces uncialis]
MTGAVGVHRVPGPVRDLSALPALDYADHFTLRTDTAATPERWARAMFGDVVTPAGWFIWRALLGLRLGRGRSPDTVAGWRVAERGEDWVRLEARSWFLACELVVRSSHDQVSLGTFLRYRRFPGRAIWPPLSAVHRRLTPGVLRDAEARVRAPGRPGEPTWSGASP